MKIRYVLSLVLKSPSQKKKIFIKFFYFICGPPKSPKTIPLKAEVHGLHGGRYKPERNTVPEIDWPKQRLHCSSLCTF